MIRISELMVRSKTGEVTLAEQDAVAQLLESDVPDVERYDLIYILGRSFS